MPVPSGPCELRWPAVENAMDASGAKGTFDGPSAGTENRPRPPASPPVAADVCPLLDDGLGRRRAGGLGMRRLSDPFSGSRHPPAVQPGACWRCWAGRSTDMPIGPRPLDWATCRSRGCIERFYPALTDRSGQHVAVSQAAGVGRASRFGGAAPGGHLETTSEAEPLDFARAIERRPARGHFSPPDWSDLLRPRSRWRRRTTRASHWPAWLAPSATTPGLACTIWHSKTRPRDWRPGKRSKSN